MNALRLTNTVCYLLLLLLLLWIQQTSAQQINPVANDLLDIAKPGNQKGWIDIRDNINISPSIMFTEYKKVFQLGNDDEMRLKEQKTDKLGMTHYKYYQYYNGYRIDGSDVVIHERNSRAQSLNGNMVTGMDKKISPALSERDALKIAIASMGNVKFLWDDEEAQNLLRDDEKDPNATWYPKGELVWSRSDGDQQFIPENFSLCWKFEVRITGESGESKRVFVNAVTGDIVRKVTISFMCDGGTGNTTWYGSQSISTKNQTFSDDFELNDDCTGSHDYKIHTKDKNNGSGTSEYEDGDNSWTSSSDQDGVNTHWCLHRTLDYFSVVQSRNSYDDKGHNVTAYNNGFGSFVSNSCWGCSGNAIDFGEGPTTSASDDWNSMEVVGHEFTHGVTQESADLDYEKQSGALNESFSDIFGTVIENWTGAGTFDWTIGEEFTSPFRSMSNPNANGDPDTYKGTNWVTTSSCTPSSGNDQCGVHTNSGVQNFFFYLLSIGGSGTNDNGDSYSVTGIGIDDAADIAYRALTVYLTSSSAYADARESWIRAANDLFGSCSTEALAVGKAWYAVGVGPDIDYYDNNVCGDILPLFGDVKYNGINSVTAAIGCTTTVWPSIFNYSVTFEAANSILLDDGFTVEEGATFYAFIDPCNISYWQRTEVAGHGDHYDASESFLEEKKVKLDISPSPFATSFEIKFNLPVNEDVQIEVCDVTGKVLRTIVPHQQLSSGSFTYRVDGSEFPAGVYIVKGLAGMQNISERVVKVN